MERVYAERNKHALLTTKKYIFINIAIYGMQFLHLVQYFKKILLAQKTFSLKCFIENLETEI